MYLWRRDNHPTTATPDLFSSLVCSSTAPNSKGIFPSLSERDIKGQQTLAMLSCPRRLEFAAIVEQGEQAKRKFNCMRI